MEKIAFLIDPLEKLNPESDSSLKMIAESIKKGFATYICQPEDLFMVKEKLYASLRLFTDLNQIEVLELSTFKMIFIRQDPPFDLQYITCTYMLETIKNQVQIINDPTSLRDHPEKLFPLSFPGFIPKTIITSRLDIAQNFIEQMGAAVLKPIYSFGGRDILAVNSKNLHAKFNYLLEKYKDKVIIQEFIPEVKNGDKRALIVNGQVVATILRKPEEGSILANLAQGGTAYKTELTERELEICQTVGKELIKKKIIFAGLDLINDYLIEINITSPTCIIPANNLYNIKIEELIFDALTK